MHFPFSSKSGSEPGSQPSDALTIGLAIAIFSLLSLLAAFFSDGFLNGDACTHYLFARYALSNPAYLVDVWGRPLVTGLYALPAAVAGRMGVRMTSLAVAVSCALVAMRIAREQGLGRPALALIFTLAQPLLFLHSFSELTELPFALVLGLAFAAFQKQRWLLLAILTGLLPLARPEGFGFLLLTALALVVYRRPGWLAVLVLPLLGWEYAAWRVSGQAGHWWNWLTRNWPWASHSLYGHGSILTFVAVLPMAVGPIVLPAMLIGIGCCLRGFLRGTGFQWHGTWASSVESRPVREFLGKHGRAARATSGHGLKTHATGIVLTAVIPLLVLAVHTLLYWQGKMASDGEARYLLIAAPFWGILSALGWEAIFVHMDWRHPIRWAGIAALVPLVVNVIHPAVPLHAGLDWQATRRLADAYGSDPRMQRNYPRLIASHPGVYYYLGIDPKKMGAERRAQVFAIPPPGTLLVWDPVFSSRNADAARVVELEALRSAGWVEDKPLTRIAGAAGWHILRSAPSKSVED